MVTLDEEKSSSLIFFTKNERGMFQWVKTQSGEKHMREKTLGGSTLTNGAGLTVILSVDVKTTTQIRKKKKNHEIRKKMETSGEEG